VPTYDYACRLCGHRFEHFAPMSDPALVRCPECRRDGLQRLIGSGAGILFKGSGFYQTDYKKPAAPTAADGKSEPSKPAAPGPDGKESSTGKGAGKDGTARPPAGGSPATSKPDGSSGAPKDKPVS